MLNRNVKADIMEIGLHWTLSQQLQNNLRNANMKKLKTMRLWWKHHIKLPTSLKD